MAEPHLGPLDRFSTIGSAEFDNVQASLNWPLSGYIGGDPRGGYWVERLTEEWKAAFGIKYAIPCNSATSGLLAACMAIGVGPGDVVWTTPYSMSATAACAKVLGAEVRFIDIETDSFGIDPSLLNKASKLVGTMGNQKHTYPKAIIVTNLFGHAAQLWEILGWCIGNGVWMIEDNAQAPFATIDDDDMYTGTIGHIGVWSLNLHKHLQAGEGGVIGTNNSDLAEKLYDAINHGELRNASTSR